MKGGHGAGLMRTMLWGKQLVLLVALASREAGAEAEATDYAQLSLEDLLQVKVSVANATGEETELREAPGIVVVVTREEILRSGARDLIDVLRMVPGFNFANDVEGTVGLAMRGIYANEGKVLILWNKMPINDLSYGSTVMGDRFGNAQELLFGLVGAEGVVPVYLFIGK